MNLNYDAFAKKSKTSDCQPVYIRMEPLSLKLKIPKISFSGLNSRFQHTDLCLGSKDPWTNLYVSKFLMGYLASINFKKIPQKLVNFVSKGLYIIM